MEGGGGGGGGVSGEWFQMRQRRSVGKYSVGKREVVSNALEAGEIVVSLLGARYLCGLECCRDSESK